MTAPGNVADLAAGLFDLGLAAFHLAFWRLLGWPASLDPAGGINRAVAQTLNVVLVYVFACCGAALIAMGFGSAGESRLLSWAGCGFWTLRAVLQPLMFPPAGWSRWLLAAFLAGALLHGWAALS